MFDDEEEDVLAPKEPQVTSNDPEERKAARRLRIKRRQEAIKRAEQPPEEVAAEEELGIVEQTTANAAEELQRLALEGTAKVTNVKVTTDEREVIRRNVCREKMESLLDRIEAEAAEMQLAYEAVSENWNSMLTIKDPLDIDIAMKEQKIKCDELLAQKNAICEQLREDLKAMDIQYHEDLDKQVLDESPVSLQVDTPLRAASNINKSFEEHLTKTQTAEDSNTDQNIKELSERVERQLTIMQRAYEKQLSLIEEALNIEREAMVDHNNKRWEALYKQRDKEELIHIDEKMAQLDEHKLEIEKIMWAHHERYREAKIELESLIQELQKELEKLKATCLINTEKIGYNYQVLKKREEENLFVRSQQKRKLNKMNDVSNMLRSKIRKAAEDNALEEKRADEEIIKLMDAMHTLEQKAYQFAHVNDYKFTQVWRMAAHRCSELITELRHAEVALHAHVLAEPPPPAPVKPTKSPLNKKQTEDEKPLEQLASFSESMKNPTLKNSREKLVKHILQLVADNTGFLVEDRLLRLIEKYQQKSRNLCTLDSIFMALEIQAEEDIELLCETFLSYAFCPICVGLEEGVSDAPGGGAPPDTPTQRSSRAASSVRARTSIAMARSMSTSTTRSIHVGFRAKELCPEDQLLKEEADEILAKCGDLQAPTVVTGAASDASGGGSLSPRRAAGRGVTVTTQPDSAVGPNPFLCPEGHYLEIEPMQVLSALGEFISKFVPPEKRKLYDILDSVKPPDFTTPSRQLTTEEIESYWAQWKNVFSPEKERLWDGMIAGLTDYLNILQEREKIHNEVVVLRQKNAALRRLVRGSLPEIKKPQFRPQYMGPTPTATVVTGEEFAQNVLLKLPPI